MSKVLKKFLTITMILLLSMPFVDFIGSENVNIFKIEAEAATFNDINQSSVFIKQGTTGSSGTCTLASAVMMVRRAAMASGNSNWASITESSMKPTAWKTGAGLYYSFTYSGISVKHASLPGGSSNTSTLINLLKSHPEGIMIYDRGIPHAIFVTDYTDGVFYCADPSPSYPSGRINISKASVKIANADEYWYVSSPSISLEPLYTTMPEPVQNLKSEKLVYKTTESIHFTWDSAKNAEEYWVYLWKDGTQLYTHNCGNKTSFTQAPSTPGKYTLIIRPSNTNGFNDSSKSYSFVINDGYVISYNANGGSNAPDNQTKIYDKDIKLSSVIPNRTGYKFLGWKTNGSNLSVDYYAGDTYSKNSDITLYAVWQKEEENHTHSFDTFLYNQSEHPHYAVYKCSCGEENVSSETSYNSSCVICNPISIVPSVSIKNNTGSKTINYGETLKFTAIASDLPTGAKLYWYIDGIKKGEGETFTVSPTSGSVEVTVKLVDTNGNVLKDSDGNKISDSQTVSVNASFWQKIISFFKNLFGLNRIIVQSFKNSI